MLLYKHDGEPSGARPENNTRTFTRRGFLTALGGLVVTSALPSTALAQQRPDDEKRMPFPYRFGDSTPPDPAEVKRLAAERQAALRTFLEKYGFYADAATTPDAGELQMLDVIYGLVRRAARYTTGAFTPRDGLRDLHEARRLWEQFHHASPHAPNLLGAAIDTQILSLEAGTRKK